MLELLLSIALSADAPDQRKSEEIVVTGQRINDAKAKLRACLDRSCPPNEDIDATLALAETQLLAGKYRDARETLLRSLGRNKDEAARYPIPVSDLYRANGKVAAHLGYDEDYYRSTWGIYRTLKQGIPSDDVRRFSSLMEVAEMMYRTRGHERARLYYRSIAHQARAAGREDIAAIAELRSAIRHLPPGSDMQVRAIERIASLDPKEMRAPVLEAKLALARLAFEQKDEAGAQAVLKDLAALNIEKPILIYTPPYAAAEAELGSGSDFAFPFSPPAVTGGEPSGIGGPKAAPTTGAGGTVTSILALSQWSSTKRLAGNFEDMWIDVGFEITPEGRVADAKIVRSKGDIFWARPLLASLKQRRYTPGNPAHSSSRRLERYTYTSGYEGATSTRTATRGPGARVEYIDLSDIASPQ